MAGTVTLAYSETRVVKTVSMTWVSDASGDVNGTLTKVVSGLLYRAVHVPDGGGTQPTNLYDVTIEDADGDDVLQGTGSNIVNTGPSDFAPTVTNGTDGNAAPTAVDSTLELKISNAGNAKGGKVVLYYV